MARYGGEEFVALLYGANRDEAARFAESARRSVEAHAFPGGETQPLGRVTLSAVSPPSPPMPRVTKP
jgi:GGDEF domain-containing protein